jgi:prepilin-type N-terminal cleavage/methylation domain-containing protein
VARTHGGGRAGMTLLELMLVMFLLALILGGGVGLFTALDFGKRQAAGLVRNVLRSAQNTAIASGSPARVRIDRASGAIRGESLVTVGTYHFEGKSLTGHGPAGSAEPEDFDERGFVGACYRPAGRLKAQAEIPLERDPAFDFTLGFSIECALYRETHDGGRVFSLGPPEAPTVALELGKNGALRARMRTRLAATAAAAGGTSGGPTAGSTDDVPSDRAGGGVILQSEPGLVPVGRWMQARLRYDRARLELLLDGAIVASEDEDSYVWRVDAPLVLSDRALPFPGRIDSLVIAAMVAGEPTKLPESVRFTADAPERVQFAAGGGLDRAVHVEPPRIGLEFTDGSRTTVWVGLYGSVE